MTNDPETGSQNELEKLQRAFLFTLTDGARLLQRSDVEGICSHTEMCFHYSERVRCGPCAVKQAQKYGITSDISDSFSPEQYRLRRRVQAAETEIGILKDALQSVVGTHRDSVSSASAKQDAIGAAVDKYEKWANVKFDPGLISLSDDGRLSYAGVDYTLAEYPTTDPVTVVRRVEQWAMDNLTALPGGRWRLRTL